MLNVFDLEVGKLYKGWWLTPRSHEVVEDVWMQQGPAPTDGSVGGAIASLSCFVFLGKETESAEEELMCKILTNQGEVGWACFAKGVHWFVKLTGDKS